MKMEIRISGMKVGHEIDVPESGYDRELKLKKNQQFGAFISQWKTTWE